MRRTLSAMAALMAVVLATAMLASATLAGATVTVPGTMPWVYAGDVENGATYDVTARGYVQTAKIAYYHVPGLSKSASGPAGQPDSPCLAVYENDINGQCVVEDANFGALVAVVIDPETGLAAEPTFVIGAGPSFVAPADGALFLTVNDLNLTYYDNNGQFSVVITRP